MDPASARRAVRVTLSLGASSPSGIASHFSTISLYSFLHLALPSRVMSGNLASNLLSPRAVARRGSLDILSSQYSPARSARRSLALRADPIESRRLGRPHKLLLGGRRDYYVAVIGSLWRPCPGFSPRPGSAPSRPPLGGSRSSRRSGTLHVQVALPSIWSDGGSGTT